jgi:ABC-2 type transport system permease protein
MVELILRLFDLLRGPIRGLGVDYVQFRAILEAKLTLDTRRQAPWVQQAKKKSSWGSLAGTLVFYGFMGLFVTSFILTARSPLVGMTIVHAFIMTMVGMAVVADYSSVLLDTTDNAILQPRPVSGRTLLVARIAHVLVYLSLLTLSLSLASFVVGSIILHPLFVPVFGVTLVCSTGLVVCFANIFYLAAMRVMDGERFRNVLMYSQMAMSIIVFGGYQLMPRLINMNLLRELTIDDRWWIYVFPPTWMAGPIDLLTGHIGVPQLILTGLALGVPSLGVWVVVVRLAPRFTRALAMLESNPDRAGTAAAGAVPGPGWLCRSFGSVSRRPDERAAFEMIWLLCSRDRAFKMRTYPTIPFLLIFALVFLLTDPVGFRHALATLPHTHKHLFVLYFACAMVPMSILQLKFSDKYEAAWVYRALPLARPGDVLMAGFKVVLMRFVVPAFAAVAVAVLAIWGRSVFRDIALAFVATVMMALLQSLLFGRRLPFSEGYGVVEGSGRSGKSFLLFLVPLALGGSHYLLTGFPGGVFLAIPLVVLLTFQLGRRYAGTSWAVLEAKA